MIRSSRKPEQRAFRCSWVPENHRISKPEVLTLATPGAELVLRSKQLRNPRDYPSRHCSVVAWGAGFGAAELRSDAEGSLVKASGADASVGVKGEFVMVAVEVLDQCVSCTGHSRSAQSFRQFIDFSRDSRRPGRLHEAGTP